MRPCRHLLPVLAVLLWSPLGAAPGEVGALPLPYPAVPTTARAGDFVLAPSREFLDAALEKGFARANFVYYGATMVSPGPGESTVRNLAGKTFTLPNSLIIPIQKGGTAKPGDIVLGHWQSGSGMQRAIVVPGGTPSAPKVRYLDIAYDNPSGAGKKEDQLKADTFHPLQDGWMAGNVIAIRAGAAAKRGIAVHFTETKVLVLGFAGFLSVADRKDCLPVPLRPAVVPRAEVFVPVMNTFTRAVVTRVDPAIGRVFVTYSFAGKPKEAALGFGDVALKLP